MPAEINAVLLLAAGSGARMQGVVEDKILAPIQGSSAFSYALRACAACDAVSVIGIVYRDPAQQAKLAAAVDATLPQKIIWIQGGAARQQSVLKGLQALPAETRHTLIHDCARPLVSTALIHRLIETVRADGAACLAHPVTDTIKRLSAAGATQRTTLEDLDRQRLWAMETPQAFRHAEILQAYQHVHTHKLQVTDDCAAAACIGILTTLVHNTAPNPKITTAADLQYIDWLLRPGA